MGNSRLPDRRALHARSGPSAGPAGTVNLAPIRCRRHQTLIWSVYKPTNQFVPLRATASYASTPFLAGASASPRWSAASASVAAIWAARRRGWRAGPWAAGGDQADAQAERSGPRAAHHCGQDDGRGDPDQPRGGEEGPRRCGSGTVCL